MPQPLIVLDTNSLIMAISSKSHYHKVWQSFLNGDYILCISNEIIEEYLEVIARNINAKVAEAVIYAILTRKNAHRLAPHYRFRLIPNDEDDNKFVDCAITANARYIVTEDKHFDILRTIPFPSVPIIGIEDFIKELNVIIHN